SRDISEAEGSAGPRRSSASATTASAALPSRTSSWRTPSCPSRDGRSSCWRSATAEALTEHLVGGYEGAAQHATSWPNMAGKCWRYPSARFEEEMKHVPAACAKLPVFCRYLSTSLSKLLAEEFDRSMEKDLEQLLDMACYGEATYLFSQVLLYNLAQTPVNGRVTRSGGWARAGEGRLGQGSRCQPLLCAAVRRSSLSQGHLGHAEHAGQAAAEPADMLTLYQLYKQQDPPPLFSSSAAIRSIINRRPSLRRSTPSILHTYVYLLAVAAAARDSSSSLDTGHSGELSLTEAAIKRASDICRSNKHVMQSVRDLIKALRYPVVAYGVLGFVEKALSDERGCDLSQASVYLILVDEVATNHPHLRPRILPMLCRLFEQFHPSLDELSQLEFKVRLVDRFVHLMFVGHVEPRVGLHAQLPH
uniref:MIF4G domain-containing protein n=1 Tax=Macrostomum lignano TaxID=282301 RepID=A0A1I8JPT1_9PLAT